MVSDSATPAHGADVSSDRTTPSELKLKRAEQELRVTWRDGRESVFSAVRLRKNCPCATCRTERETQSTDLLPVLKQAPSEISLANARLVGSYAVQLVWSDGHDAGIYDYKYLRAMDEDS